MAIVLTLTMSAVYLLSVTTYNITSSWNFIYVRKLLLLIIVKFKTSCKDDCGWITQLKQQIWKRRYYLAAHRRLVNVLTSNSAFFIFAVLVV